MGKDRREEDQYGHPQRNFVIGMNRRQHDVGALIVVCVEDVVKQPDEDGTHRQQEQKG